MKIALVHEFLNQLGGAEKVLQNFLEIWPDATVHVILYDRNKTNGEFEKYQRKVSWLNSILGVKTHPRLFLAAMPTAIESFKFYDYDLVLSDSSSFAHGIKTGKLHICYCHTPARFLWTESDYLKQQKYPEVFKWLGSKYLQRLKRWNFNAAQRPNYFIANSVNVQNRIKNFYNRDSVVIAPPVDTEFYQPTGAKQDYFFTVSRLEPYKKTDIMIEAFNTLGLPLKVAGTGTDLDRLKSIGKPNIEFLGRASDDDLRKHYSQAKAFIFAASEDAGITCVEAQACGTPVIGYRAGGALETVVEGTTGEFFDHQTVESLMEKIKNFDPAKYNSEIIRQNAEKFSKKIFQDKIKNFIEDKYAHRT